MPVIYTAFDYELLKELRTSAGVSQKEMAHQLGVSPSVYSYYELGKSLPKYATFLTMAGLFTMYPPEFFKKLVTDDQDVVKRNEALYNRVCESYPDTEEGSEKYHGKEVDTVSVETLQKMQFLIYRLSDINGHRHSDYVDLMYRLHHEEATKISLAADNVKKKK